MESKCPLPVLRTLPALVVALIANDRAVGQIVQGGSTAGLSMFRFDGVRNHVSPWTPNVAICGPGIWIGERMVGQTTAPSGMFEVVQGNPTPPLAIDGTVSERAGVSVFSGATTGDLDMAPEGSLLWPNPSSLGEGSFSVVFATDQTTIGFGIGYADSVNSASIRFFDRQGAPIGQLQIQHPTASTTETPVSFTVQGGPGIAAITVDNTDPGGLGYDDFLYAATAAPMVARVSVKRVLGPSGQGDPFWTAATIAQWVADSSAIFERTAGIKLVIDEVVDLLDPGTPGSWFAADAGQKQAYEAAAEADPCRFKWRADAINVYLCSTLAGAGGICSFAACPPDDNDIILVQPNILNASVGLAHEIGHYFNLRHTHANHEGATCGCPGGTSGDCVWDTLDDADPAACVPFSTACHNANLTALGYPQPDYDNLRYNLMSYHGPIAVAQAILTCGQAARALGAVTTWRGQVIMGQPRPAITAVSPLTAVYPGPLALQVTGSSLPVTGAIAVRTATQVSASAAATATQITGTFGSALTPGVHCVSVTQDGHLRAYSASGVQILPSLRQVPNTTSPANITLELQSLSPGSAAVLALGLPSAISLPVPGFLFTLDIVPLVVLPVTTDAQALFRLVIPLAGLASGATVAVQGADVQGLLPWRFTNAELVYVP